ncbi:MAG: glycosyltransferase, partial [Chthoniobacteraceae bacterium]
MSLPTISVVTPTLNRAHFLGEAIESVRTQNYPNVEFIIVDGMSSDGTMDLLAGYPDIQVICEPDDGLYDAINKGIRAGKGDFIALLNSDDVFPPNLFHELAGAFAEPKIEAVYGRAEIFLDDANMVTSDRFAAA